MSAESDQTKVREYPLLVITRQGEAAPDVALLNRWLTNGC